MKKEIVSFAVNIAAIFCVTAIIIGVSPNLSANITQLAQGIDKISRPYSEIKKASAEISLIISENDADNNNTAQEESEDVMKNITAEDSSADIDLKETPEDILTLMAEAKKTITRVAEQ